MATTMTFLCPTSFGSFQDLNLRGPFYCHYEFLVEVEDSKFERKVPSQTKCLRTFVRRVSIIYSRMKHNPLRLPPTSETSSLSSSSPPFVPSMSLWS